MPNVGKSTLYNALSNCSIPAENFPFCTIDPNSTRVHVPDDRFDWLVDHHKPKSVVQPFLEIVDIAGLVKVRGWKTYWRKRVRPEAYSWRRQRLITFPESRLCAPSFQALLLF